MERQDHHTRINGRVRIKDSVTSMYPKARVYMEGTVRAQRHDEFGYPMVLVEWDKNHWAYSGEVDGWTFDSHFDPIGEDKVSQEKFDLLAALAHLVEQAKSEEAEVEPEGENPEDSRVPQYLEALETALKEAREGVGFVMIVATQSDIEGSEVLIPHIYRHARREDAAALLEAAASDFAAQTHLQAVHREIAHMRKDGSDRRPPRMS